MRRAIACVALAGALGTAAPSPAAALALPELVGGMGGTFGASDAPGDGGLSLALAALWRFEGPLAFGPMVFADDLGTRIGRLRDPNDGSDLGASALDHALTFGAAWRLDAAAPGFGSHGAWRPFASTTFGAYRVQGDELGIARRALTATGASVAAGLRFVPGRKGAAAGAPGAGVGLSVRHHRVFHEDFTSYTSVAVDWIWPLGAGAPRVQGP